MRHGGQQWTTLGELQTSRDSAIGQRAMLVRTSDGNLRWDCVALLDEETIGAVRDLGGIAAIPISHPHSYTAMVEWSAAFGGVPIHLHEAARACAGRLISGAGSDCGLSAGSN